MKFPTLLICFLCLSISLAACGSDDNTPDAGDNTPDAGDNTQVSFSEKVQPLVQASCSCHYGGAAAGLSLKGSPSDWIDKDSTLSPNYKFIVAGAPDKSLIYLKMLNNRPDDVSGDIMPQSGALEASQTDIIKNWITQGAKDN